MSKMVFLGGDNRWNETSSPWGRKGSGDDANRRRPLFARDRIWSPPRDERQQGPTTFPVFSR